MDEAVLLESAQALIDDAAIELNINQGDLTMFILDVSPDITPQYAPMVIAQASQSQETVKFDRTVGICKLVGISSDSEVSAMEPEFEVMAYFNRLENHKIDEAVLKFAKTTILKHPVHGLLEFDEVSNSFTYTPSSTEYIGRDRATLLVEIGNYKVKVEYYFNLMQHAPIGTQGNPYTTSNCPKNTRVWKISQDANGNPILAAMDAVPETRGQEARKFGGRPYI